MEIHHWTDRDGTPAWGVVPTGPGEISLYVAEHLRYPTHRLRRFTLRTDGFVSVNAPYSGGELATKSIQFKGSNLVLNYSTSAVGHVRVEVQDGDGNPITGYRLDDSEVLFGDEVEHIITWKNGVDLKKLEGVVDVQIHHFTGKFSVGEDLVYVLVAGAHRQNVFGVLQEAVERYKHETPVFKKEHVLDETGAKEAYWVSEREAQKRRKK